MAATHGKDAYFLWNSVNLSPYLTEFSLSRDLDTAETSTMGDSSKEYIAGMKDATIDCSFIFEAGSGTVDATLGDAQGTSAAFEIRANSASVGVTNPKYTGTAILTSYELSPSIGDAVAGSASFQVTGAITRATS